MFTCARIKANRGNGADFYRKHLSCNDYFSECESIEGTWRGSLAAAFHLSGQTVDPKVFSQFQQNVNPCNNTRLTARNVKDSVRFYDFQCSAQKSVSILSLFDPRLVDAHREAVAIGMSEMERFAAVRLRSGIHANTNNVEFTGNFLYAEYHHDSSRLLDPQLHTHNVIVNVTRDKDGNFRALQNREMLRAIRYANKVYLNELARSCMRLGYEIETKYREKNEIVGFEIKGVSDEVIERCSRRRAQIDQAIEKFAETHGRQPTADEVNALTLLTRNRKMLERSDRQVQEHKLSFFTEEEKQTFRQIEHRAFNRGSMFLEHPDESEIKEALGKVAGGMFERESVLSWDKLMAETLNRNLGRTELSDMKEGLRMLSGVINLEEPAVNPYFTTPDHLARERFILETVEKPKGSVMNFCSDYIPFSDAEDTFDHSAQQKVIESIIGCRDPFMMFRGVAGAGKTSALQELCKCLQKGGVSHIHVVAPTNSAVDVLRTEGFGSAQTVARFLQEPQTLPPRGAYLIVDESGLNSVKQGFEMMKLALKKDYRLLFVGDERQHSSVEAGDFFRLLEQHSAITRTALTAIHRQQPLNYRHGIELAAAGAVAESFDHFDSQGFIHENRGKYLDESAESFLRLTDDGRRPLDCIAAAPTIRECELLTDKIRDRMKKKGLIDTATERQVETFRSWGWTKERLGDTRHYQAGMKIFFTSRIKGLGTPGEMAEVASVHGLKVTLTDGRTFYPSQHRGRFDVGELKIIPIGKGDVVRLSVNLRTADYKINNGSLAVATGNPNEFILLDHNRKELTTVRLPENFRGFRHGWVITSHSSQGMTSKNVVAAAEKMSAQAFYVACSRGKQNLALHVPEKDFFRDRLVKIPTERLSVTDLAASGVPVWKAPILPPPPDRVAARWVQRAIAAVRGCFAKIERKVLKFVHNSIYQTFTTNLRRNDYARRQESGDRTVRNVPEVPNVPERVDRSVERTPRFRPPSRGGFDL